MCWITPNWIVRWHGRTITPWWWQKAPPLHVLLHRLHRIHMHRLLLHVLLHRRIHMHRLLLHRRHLIKDWRRWRQEHRRVTPHRLRMPILGVLQCFTFSLRSHPCMVVRHVASRHPPGRGFSLLSSTSFKQKSLASVITLSSTALSVLKNNSRTPPAPGRMAARMPSNLFRITNRSSLYNTPSSSGNW